MHPVMSQKYSWPTTDVVLCCLFTAVVCVYGKMPVVMMIVLVVEVSPDTSGGSVCS